jgi:hypothetical protein
MIPIPKSSRRVALIIAAVVALLTVSVVGNAVTTVSVPNAVIVSYNLGPNGISPAISVPANQGVQVMGTCITSGVRGVGEAALLSIPGAFLEWVGLHSPSGAFIAQGFSGAVGTLILYIDFPHQCRIEVNNSVSIRVHNTNATNPRAGNVKLIW